MLDSPERPGSMRRSARELGVDILVYEGGEGLRFDEAAIATGVAGVVGVMRAVGMLDDAASDRLRPVATAVGTAGTVMLTASRWIRAPDGGIFNTGHRLGDTVDAGQVIGTIASPFETGDIAVIAPRRGLVIGETTLPVVNMGDALFHIAWSDDMTAIAPRGAEPLLDEDEIL
jgi:hypothetical protein